MHIEYSTYQFSGKSKGGGGPKRVKRNGRGRE